MVKPVTGIDKPETGTKSVAVGESLTDAGGLFEALENTTERAEAAGVDGEGVLQAVVLLLADRVNEYEANVEAVVETLLAQLAIRDEVDRAVRWSYKRGES